MLYLQAIFTPVQLPCSSTNLFLPFNQIFPSSENTTRNTERSCHGKKINKSKRESNSASSTVRLLVWLVERLNCQKRTEGGKKERKERKFRMDKDKKAGEEVGMQQMKSSL